MESPEPVHRPYQNALRGENYLGRILMGASQKKSKHIGRLRQNIAKVPKQSEAIMTTNNYL